jgi:uncharacterized protein
MAGDGVEVPVVNPEPDAAPVIASHAAPRRRRRWPWVVLACFVGLVVVALAGVVWYFSGQIGANSAVPQPESGFPMSITAVDGGRVSYSGVPSGWTDQGLQGLASVEGGYAQTDGLEPSGYAAGTRTVTTQVLPPDLAVGQQAALDGHYFPRDPKTGFGADFEDVTYDSPLGPTPAWYIPGTGSAWVIVIHGRGAAPTESLRVASVTSRLGYPTLVIRYRNDAGAPAGNGYAQWGKDEWQDLEAAVQYALDNGAERVVLAGLSMGGGMSLALLENSPLADSVVGLFMDAPMTSFSQRVDLSAQDMGVPGFVATLAKQVASWRYGFDWSAIDYTSRAADITKPMLIVQGSEDGTVAPVMTEEFAAAANPDLVQREVFEGAGHVSSWNVERTRYEQLLTDFLARVAPPA